MLLKLFHWIFIKHILLLSIFSGPSSFRLVNVIANVLMRCVVAMVSNVSDSSNPWSGMLLYTHMLKHSVLPQRECHTHICKHTHAYTACTNTLKGLCGMHVCLQEHKKVCVQECKVVYVRTKQLQLPAQEEKLPVALL